MRRLHGENGNLILTRQLGEEILVTLGGEEVVIAVTKLNSERVRLAVQAPRSVRVLRRELAEDKPTEARTLKVVNALEQKAG